MHLKQIYLQNFRSYLKAEFSFSKDTTFVIGPNTSGKTNLIESIYLLSTGKSFRVEKDLTMISFGKEVGRVKGIIYYPDETEGTKETEGTELEVVIADKKKFLVNGVSKRRVDFTSHLPTVLFSPQDLDIIITSPSIRRQFLDEVLEQVDREYRLSLWEYTKALRQRNALLQITREKGIRNEKQFDYWDTILIKEGNKITTKRDAFIQFLNHTQKDIFDFAILYEKSVISKERLLQYKDAEVASGVTLVGPHRDDFLVCMYDNARNATHDMKLFASRGQQRLSVLQMKMLSLLYIETHLKQKPLLLLDDIFSELDSGHIHLVTEMIQKQQTVITTTHKEFIDEKLLQESVVVELGN